MLQRLLVLFRNAASSLRLGGRMCWSLHTSLKKYAKGAKGTLFGKVFNWSGGLSYLQGSQHCELLQSKSTRNQQGATVLFTAARKGSFVQQVSKSVYLPPTQTYSSALGSIRQTRGLETNSNNQHSQQSQHK